MSCNTLSTVSHTSSSSALFPLLFLDVQQPCHSEFDEMVYNADDNTRLRACQIQRFNKDHPGQISANDVNLAERIAPDYSHERYNAEDDFPNEWDAKPKSLPVTLQWFRKNAEKLLGRHKNQAVSLLGLEEEQESVEHNPTGK